MTSRDIRSTWIRFFEEKGHKLLPSASLIPVNDDSLLWINAGVATIKPFFDGSETPPSPRLVNIQKAIRTGDIDNVGKTARHHTFFEMLGNFSIGDYFKKEAIEMAWELLTSKDYLSIDKDKLYITVYEEDEESRQIWMSLGIDESRIYKMSKKTNFWDMGKGPSGPSSEIFIDRGEKYDKRDANELIANDIENDRFVEIWNIVFSQYNNDGKGNYTELPQKNIDTGAGLERIVSALQDTPTNFETDLFKPIILELEKYTDKKYLFEYIPEELKSSNPEQDKINSMFKAIVDFTRSLTFAIADGATPEATGRGYVLRRLLRKGSMYARSLQIEEPVMYKLVDVIVNEMSDFYPNIKSSQDKIKEIIKKEEEAFNNTIEKSMKLFDKEVKDNNLTPEIAFKLFETYGMPLEMIESLSQSRGISIDMDNVQKLFDDFKATSRANQKETQAMSTQDSLFTNLDKTEFIGYDNFESKSKVIDINGDLVVFDKTPFYATSGGQEHDKGKADSFDVTSVEKNGKSVFIHKIEGHNFEIGQEVNLSIDIERRKKITRNHSATHLLFSAFDEALGQKVPQMGSKVEEEFFRFDFAFSGRPTEEQIYEAEKLANQWIKDATEVTEQIVDIKEAKAMGASFLQGAKYSDQVRVVKMNESVIDLCGGTHVSNTKEVDSIVIYNFERKGSGVYRLEAATAEYAQNKNRESNELFIQKHMEQANSRMKSVQERNEFFGNEIDTTNLQNVFNRFNEIDINKDRIDVKNKFNEIKNEFNSEYSNIDKELVDKMSDSLKQLIEDSSKISTIEISGFSIKDVNRIATTLMSEATNKILFIKLTSGEKGTVAAIISKDNVNDENVERIKKAAQDSNLRGNGKNQLYVFGGTSSNSNKMIEEIKTWE